MVIKVMEYNLPVGATCIISKKNCVLNPLHHNISLPVLHTVLYTLPMMLTRRICQTIKKFILITLHVMFDSELIQLGEIRC